MNASDVELLKTKSHQTPTVTDVRCNLLPHNSSTGQTTIFNIRLIIFTQDTSKQEYTTALLLKHYLLSHLSMHHRHHTYYYFFVRKAI